MFYRSRISNEGNTREQAEGFKWGPSSEEPQDYGKNTRGYGAQ